MNRYYLSGWFAFLLLCGISLSTFAQEEIITFRLSRDWGYGSGGNIRGRFSYRVSTPNNVAHVTFLINGEPIAEDNEAPFEYQFHTDDFPAGINKLSVSALTSDGQTLYSQEITRNFLTPDEESAITNKMWTWMIGGTVGIVLLIILGNIWIARRNGKSGKASIKSVWGTAVCPKCSQPFGMHIWKLNLGLSTLDRCPHCRKWSRVQRATDEEIEAAFEATTTPSITSPLSQEEQLRKKLEDSRFDE
ncbi:MAG: zf-TFIIB domain-containing protein [Chloroflexi bacterium]|nr:zf-TFIIB domain-containing protein [Chloroflexota bacterium]